MVVYIFLCILCLPLCARAATFTLADGALATVQACMASTSPCSGLTDGDTVIIPAGSWSWSSRVTVTKNITLQGHGSDIDNPSTPTTITITANDTGLQLEVEHSAVVMRVTGFTFDGGTGGGLSPTQGILTIVWDTRQAQDAFPYRVDHNHFIARRTAALVNYQSGGVIDHNTFTEHGNNPGIYNLNGQGANSADSYGDGSWAIATQPGAAVNRLFIEDNSFTAVYSGTPTIVWAYDGWLGARVVYRYNTHSNTWFSSHGLDTSGRQRSHRYAEVYNNTFTMDSNMDPFYRRSAIAVRGGGGLYYNNTVTSVAGDEATASIVLTNYRSSVPHGDFGSADGASPWDGNEGTTYASGTHNGGNQTSLVIDTTKSWTTNQWVGYSVHLGVQNIGTEILSNTATQLTLDDSHKGSPFTVTNSDTYTIQKVVWAMDGMGRGVGDLVLNVPPVNQACGSSCGNGNKNPRQASEPLFAWNNTFNGAPYTMTSDQYYIAVNVNFFNRAPQSGDWLYPYTPYTYPHPLVGAPVPVSFSLGLIP